MSIESNKKINEKSENKVVIETITDIREDIADTFTEKGNLSDEQYIEYLKLTEDINSDDPTPEYDHFSAEYDEEKITRRELRHIYLECLLKNYSPKDAKKITLDEMHGKPYANINIREIINQEKEVINQEKEIYK